MSTETDEDVRQLDELTVALDKDYENWKIYEAFKEIDKARFFELANEELSGQPAEKLVVMEADNQTEEQVVARVKRHNPGWKVDEWREEEDGTYEVILIEDTTLKAFTYINKKTGRVFQRTARKGSMLVDDDYMQKADPKLYEEVTFELPWGDRIMRPIKMFSAEQMARCAKFIYRGKPSISLAPPRDATLEELQ